MSSVTTIKSEVPARRSAAESNGHAEAATDRRLGIAAHQAFWLLRIAFTVAPILFGLDKFFNWSVDWPDYLRGWVNSIAPGAARTSCTSSEGSRSSPVSSSSCPSYRRFVVAAWLGGIVINLLTVDPPRYYDIALRDFGLCWAR